MTGTLNILVPNIITPVIWGMKIWGRQLGELPILIAYPSNGEILKLIRA